MDGLGAHPIPNIRLIRTDKLGAPLIPNIILVRVNGFSVLHIPKNAPRLSSYNYYPSLLLFYPNLKLVHSI